jgi:hypothetical protein
MATCITKLAYQECLDRTSTSSESTSRTLELTNMTTATSTLHEFDFLIDVNASALCAATRVKRSREEQQEEQKLSNLRHQTLQHQTAHPLSPPATTSSLPALEPTSSNPPQASANISLPASAFTFTPHLELQ